MRSLAGVMIGALLVACGETAPAAPSVAPVARAPEAALPDEAAGARADSLGVTPASDEVPAAPWVALELRLEEGERSRDSWSRETLVRLERGVLRVRTHAELHRHDEPDLDASVVLDEPTRAALEAAMHDAALLADVVDVAEPEGFHFEELAGVLERDGTRTRVVVENPATEHGVAALAAMQRAIALARAATAPPEPPP